MVNVPRPSPIVPNRTRQKQVDLIYSDAHNDGSVNLSANSQSADGRSIGEGNDMAKTGGLQNFWPAITNVQSAAKAVHDASMYAYWVAALTAAFAVWAMFYGPVLGIDGYGIADAAVMAFIGWRISKFSETWTTIAILYWGGNILYKATTQPGLGSVRVVSILILLGFINGLRGVLGYSKFSKKPELEQQL